MKKVESNIMKTLKTEYHLPVKKRSSNAINERLLFLINSVEFYGRNFDKQDKGEVRLMLKTLKVRGEISKHALRVKKVLNIA